MPSLVLGRDAGMLGGFIGYLLLLELRFDNGEKVRGLYRPLDDLWIS